MLPTSLPGGSPSGITAARPTSDRAAIAARCGIAATSSGVRPPSSALGSSAQPSGTRTTYFTAAMLRDASRGAPRRSPFYPPRVVSPPTARRRARRSVPAVLVVLVVLVVLASWCAATTADAASKPPRLRLQRVAAVTGATAMATRMGDPALYVATQDGQVLALRGKAEPVTVLDLTRQVRSGGEQGLLGLAFSPDGTKLYAHFSGAAAG